MQTLTSREYAHLFVLKLYTILRGGYGWNDLGNDTLAGLTVAVVALPLAMALAIASGAAPEKGLHTAIIAGFLISALGGSRVQIGGPTAAFIPVVFVVIQQYGYGGLILCTLLPARTAARRPRSSRARRAPARSPRTVRRAGGR